MPTVGMRVRRLFGRSAPDPLFPIDYRPPGEAGKSYQRRVRTGFLARYCSGPIVLDVGYSGYDNPDGLTAVPHAVGIDLETAGYDGLTLPYANESVDSVLSSHCLEHVPSDQAAIREWMRVLRIGGFLVCMVPHQALYEKRLRPPSRWNADHKRFYTPASLLCTVEDALPANSFRIRHCKENDAGFDYALGPDVHAQGCYEIELVLEKIAQPHWMPA